jgi:CubicO group peptidase (beta-lactamase class C family)
MAIDSADSSMHVDEVFASWPRGIAPGVVVAITKGGRVLHLKGYGLANLETKSEIGPNTSFRLASLTKQFTSAAVMLLSERGKLSYDDYASHFLPEFSTHARHVTIRHLLHHTSGLPDYEELFLATGILDTDYPRSSKRLRSSFEPSSKDVTKLVGDKMLRFAPGDEWEYGNSGYVALARIVETVSDRSFAEFLEENIFLPLGMGDSFLYDRAQPPSGAALSYTAKDSTFEDIDYTPLNAVYGQDGIYSTASDLMKWYSALGCRRVVKAPSLTEAFASGEVSIGAKTGYGFGWFVGNSLSLRRVAHTGSWAGFRNLIAYYPEHDFTVFALSNFDGFDDVARSATACCLATIYLSDEMSFHPPVKVSRDVMRRYEGRYELATGHHLDVKLEGSALHVNPHCLFPIRLVPESEVKFFVEGAAGDSYFFYLNEGGDVRGLTRYLSLFGYTKDAYTTAWKVS